MHKMRQQEKLRNACKTGDLSEVNILLQSSVSFANFYCVRIESSLDTISGCYELFLTTGKRRDEA